MAESVNRLPEIDERDSVDPWCAIKAILNTEDIQFPRGNYRKELDYWIKKMDEKYDRELFVSEP